MRKVVFKKVTFCEMAVPDDITTEQLAWWANHGYCGTSPLTTTTLDKIDDLPTPKVGPWEIVAETPILDEAAA